jgi:ABC-type dipeptide/oligopeptide/nickel transport system permease component
MGIYILKRLLWMIPVVLGVAILIFTIMYFCPGDPAVTILGSNATEDELEAKREELGLNRPYHIRLYEYMKGVFIEFDFGRSYVNNVRITEEIIERFPRTVMISVVCILIAIVVGIPLGINAAIHQGGIWDNISMVIALLGVSMPSFWLALMLSLTFALRLGWLPALGYTSLAHYILPCISNSFRGLAMQARQMRSGMLEVIRSDYITTARAKGLSKFKVIFGHALPNALIPVITVAGTTFGRMLGGTVVVDSQIQINHILKLFKPIQVVN